MTVLDEELTTIALCWRLERRDGAAIGFTSHDRDLRIAGLRYRAAPGMLPSAISLSDGFEAETLEVEGALTSDTITTADLKGGRWDGAAVSIFVADWSNPELPLLPLVQGELGDVQLHGAHFEAELRSQAAQLERAVVEQTSPECRAELGDKRCRVDMAGRSRLVRISAVISDAMVEVASGLDATAYGYGKARWLSGRNSGVELGIRPTGGTRLALADEPPHPAAAGDLLLISEGCDKSLETCSSRFGNAVNFRGEPHLPGVDVLTRYPGA